MTPGAAARKITGGLMLFGFLPLAIGAAARPPGQDSETLSRTWVRGIGLAGAAAVLAWAITGDD